MANTRPIYLTENDVKSVLNWDTLVPVIETAMKEVSNRDHPLSNLVQPPRLMMLLPSKKGLLLSMPAYSGDSETLACKLVTSFTNNPDKGLPSTMGTILLFDSSTGKVKAIVEATEITAWRTAAASMVATKYLSNGSKILAILGSGAQGRSHALVLDHFYHFHQIRIWNHKKQGSERLSKELAELGKPVISCDSVEDCVKDADIIVTATFAMKPILQGKWIKPGAHINAVGVGVNHHSELDQNIYETATIYTDSMIGAKIELQGLIDKGIEIEGEIGELINGTKSAPRDKITVFQSLGMAVEDAVSVQLIYDEFQKKNGRTIIN